MLDQILYKLRWSASGEWSARLLPDECRALSAYLERLEADLATISVQHAQLTRECTKLIRAAKEEGLL